jgi:hypothetical protein
MSTPILKVARNVSDAVMRRTLVIHMDINRTIIQTDPAGGKTLEDVLNSNVAARVFGVIVDGTFVVREGRFDRVSAADSSTDGVSYADYADAVVQPPPNMRTGSAEERRAIWRDVSAKRRSMLHSFTHAESVGSAFVPQVEEQRVALAETLAHGFHIVPSFFELVNNLSELSWPFVVIFRTFGDDLEKVLDEWNAFLDGRHLMRPRGPILEGMRGGVPQCGALFRCEKGIAISWNRNRAVPPPPAGVDSQALRPEEYLRTVPGVSNVHPISYHELYEELMSKSRAGGNVLGLIDYYHYWSQHAEHRSAGKCFPVDASPNAPFQVFFDDNIFIGDPSSIVDMRDAETGSPMRLDREEVYCCHVLPFFAITEPDYFWNETLERVIAQMTNTC